MFLSGVVFVLFLAGCWLYCLTDAVLTPPSEFVRLPKRAWVAVIAVTFVAGALAWVINRAVSRRARSINAFLAADALARHPATQARKAAGGAVPIGPDDDPEFLLMLDRFISGPSDADELSTSYHSVISCEFRARRAAGPERVLR